MWQFIEKKKKTQHILKWIGDGKIVHPIARLGSVRVGSLSGGAFSKLAIDY